MDLSALKPSELIRLAVGDMKKVEQSEEHTLDMDDWYYDLDNGGCSVCMAGAVMLYTNKMRDSLYKANNEYGSAGQAVRGSKYAARYVALDELRKGDYLRFCEYLGVPTKQTQMLHNEVRELDRNGIYYMMYSVSPVRFYEFVEGVAEFLDSVGY